MDEDTLLNDDVKAVFSDKSISSVQKIIQGTVRAMISGVDLMYTFFHM